MTGTAGTANGDTAATLAASRLKRWVTTTLVEGYQLHDRIPECWEQHPGVMAELSVIMDLFAAAGEPAEHLACFDALERVVKRVRDQYPAGECLKDRAHKIPRRWPSQPDDRAAARQAARR